MLLAGQSADFVLTDQVSATNLAVRMFRLARKSLVFYCHYPDVLLCTDRSGFFKRIYRLPFDSLERYTTGMCDVLLVNSEFTAETLRSTFENVDRKVHVVYPPVDTSAVRKTDDAELREIVGPSKFFVSLNRYERKKDLPLAVEAMSDFIRVAKRKDMKLVVAGGYDPRLAENVDHFKELESLISTHSLSKYVVMLRNVSDPLRSSLLAAAEAVISESCPARPWR